MEIYTDFSMEIYTARLVEISVEKKPPLYRRGFFHEVSSPTFSAVLS